MYISGGFNVYPAEVEGIILRHPDVGQVAVVGAPDQRMGEVGEAFVVSRAGHGWDEEEFLSGAGTTWPITRCPTRSGSSTPFP